MNNQRFYLCIDTSAGSLKTTSFVEVIESVFYAFIDDLKKGGLRDPGRRTSLIPDSALAVTDIPAVLGGQRQ